MLSMTIGTSCMKHNTKSYCKCVGKEIDSIVCQHYYGCSGKCVYIFLSISDLLMPIYQYEENIIQLKSKIYVSQTLIQISKSYHKKLTCYQNIFMFIMKLSSWIIPKAQRSLLGLVISLSSCQLENTFTVIKKRGSKK